MTDYLTGTEVDSGDTLDGATIYAKVVNFGALPNTGTKSVAHGISFNQIVAVEFMASSGVPNRIEVGYAEGTSPRVIIEAVNVRVVTAQNYSPYTGLIFFHYTK